MQLFIYSAALIQTESPILCTYQLSSFAHKFNKRNIVMSSHFKHFQGPPDTAAEVPATAPVLEFAIRLRLLSLSMYFSYSFWYRS